MDIAHTTQHGEYTYTAPIRGDDSIMSPNRTGMIAMNRSKQSRADCKQIAF